MALRALLAELESGVRSGGIGTVGISRGKFAYREAVMKSLETGKPISIYGIPHGVQDIIGPILHEFHRERIKRKIIMRHIYNHEAVERAKLTSKWKFTESRVFPQKYDSAVATQICDNKVTLFTFGDDISVIEIHDPLVAKSYQGFFDMLWKKSRVV